MSRITAYVLARAMAEHPKDETELVASDRVTYQTRRTLENLAANLRAMAAASKDSAAAHDTEGRTDDAEHWAGRAAGLMDAHGMVMGILTADKPKISVGDEVRFLWSSQATPALADIDCHYDVVEVRDGMVGVKRTIHRPRAAMHGMVHHWAPLTAVERCTDGHRCPTAEPATAATESEA